MAKPEWGLKRTCQSCGARFYDMGKSPIACPKCGAQFDADALLKTRRSKAAAPRPVPAAVVEPEEAEPAAEVVAEEDAAEEKEDAVMEDTSELGEDDEDVADVIDNVGEEDER